MKREKLTGKMSKTKSKPAEKKQINYLTAIIPTQQGFKMPAILQRTPVEIKMPKFQLDYVGDKEGFFIYWLKSR